MKTLSDLIDTYSVEQIIKTYIYILNKNCETMFALFSEWREKYKNCSEMDAIGQCMLQMTICNIRSIISLCPGIQITQECSTTIVDPISMIPILRSVYERTYIYHNIFIETENDDEKDILLSIWKIKGLNNRQNLSNVPAEYKSKEQQEKNDIASIRNSVIEKLNKMEITETAKAKIAKVTTKEGSSITGYSFIKDNGTIVNFESIPLNRTPILLFGEDCKVLYTLLATHAHPSYLGTLQFGQMYNEENEDKQYVITILNSLLLCQVLFVTDFCKATTGASKIFASLSQNDQDWITNPFKSIEKLKQKGM